MTTVIYEPYHSTTNNLSKSSSSPFSLSQNVIVILKCQHSACDRRWSIMNDLGHVAATFGNPSTLSFIKHRMYLLVRQFST